jgi:FKBP-type peptidyl-prolyl cis-trans isomerase SlpA
MVDVTVDTKGVPIGPGTKLTLLFSLKLDDGEVVDSTGDKPAELNVGDGNLLPGFEAAMFGLKAGDKQSLLVQAKDGFGLANPDNVQKMKRSQFKANMELAEGLMMSFADAQNAELPGVILSVDEKYVEIDFNHPLSGKDLIFDVEILSVEQISNDILRVR